MSRAKLDPLPPLSVAVLSGLDGKRKALRLIEDDPDLRRYLFSLYRTKGNTPYPPAWKEAIFEFTKKVGADEPLWWRHMVERGLVEPNGDGGWKTTELWEAHKYEHQVPTYRRIKDMKQAYEQALQVGYQEEWKSWAEVKKANKTIHDKMFNLSPLFFDIQRIYDLNKAENDTNPAKSQSRSHPRRTSLAPEPRSSRTRPSTPGTTQISSSSDSSSSDSESSGSEYNSSDSDDETFSDPEVPLGVQRRQSDRVRLGAGSETSTRTLPAGPKDSEAGGMKTRSSRRRLEADKAVRSEDEEKEEEAGPADDDRESGKSRRASSERGGTEERSGVTTRSGKKRAMEAEPDESEADGRTGSSKRARRASPDGKSRRRVIDVDRNMVEILEQLELQEREAAKARSGAAGRRGVPSPWVEDGRETSPEVEAEAVKSEKKEEVLPARPQPARRPRPFFGSGGSMPRVEIPGMKKDKEKAGLPAAAKPKPAEVKPKPQLQLQPAKKSRILPNFSKNPTSSAPTPSSAPTSSASTPSLTRSERDSSDGNSPATPLPVPLPSLPTTSTLAKVRSGATTASVSLSAPVPRSSYSANTSGRFDKPASTSASAGQNVAIPPTRLPPLPLVPSSIRPAPPVGQATTTTSTSQPLSSATSDQSIFGLQAIHWNDPVYNDAFLDTLYSDSHTRSTLLPSLHPLPTDLPARDPAKVERDLYVKVMTLEPGQVWLNQAHLAAWAGMPTKGRSAGMWKAASGWPLTGLVYGFAERVEELSDAWQRGIFEMRYAGQFHIPSEVPSLTDKITFLFGPSGLVFSLSPSPSFKSGPLSPHLPLELFSPSPPPAYGETPLDLFSPSPSPSRDSIPLHSAHSTSSSQAHRGVPPKTSKTREQLRAEALAQYAGKTALPKRPEYANPEEDHQRMIERCQRPDGRMRPEDEYRSMLQLAYALENWAVQFAPVAESNLISGMAMMSCSSAKAIAETLLDAIICRVFFLPHSDRKRRTYHRLAFSMETIGDIALYNRVIDLVHVTGADHLDRHQIKIPCGLHNNYRFELHLRRPALPKEAQVHIDQNGVHQISLMDYLIYVAQTFKMC